MITNFPAGTFYTSVFISDTDAYSAYIENASPVSPLGPCSPWIPCIPYIPWIPWSPLSPFMSVVVTLPFLSVTVIEVPLIVAFTLLASVAFVSANVAFWSARIAF